jgi:hypothetical protein
MADVFSLGSIVTIFLESIIAFAALVISNKVIAHELDAKRLLIMSLVALFVTPIVGQFIFGALSIPFIGSYLLPLLVWIVLGEVLLKADMRTKLKVAAVGYFAYLLLSIMVAPYLFALLAF